MEWWRGSVTYQIYPRSFQDSTGSGVGDLAGITLRLDHVARLGADAIWLSPVFPSPMADMGYDVSDHTGIDPSFGTLEDFDVLLRRAHDLGLKVIIDQVLSHSSDQHPHFIESRTSRDNPKSDWYVWADANPDGSPPNNWLSVFGGSAWEWDSRRRQYYLHNFLPSQPDFNFHNPQVQDWLLETLRFWLDRGVDGFRLDTVNYYFHDAAMRSNPPEPGNSIKPAVNPYDMQRHLHSKTQPENITFLERLRGLLDQYHARTMVGEVGETAARSLPIMADYTRPGRLHMAYSFALLGPEFTAAHFRTQIEGFFAAAPEACPCWSFSNHDVMRHVSRWSDHGEAEPLARLAAAMLVGFEGSICLYQGEELGQTETDILYHELTDPPGIRFWPDYKGRDGCRTPMVWEDAPQGGFTTGTPWLPVKPEQAARHAAGQDGVAGSVLESYRALLAFRRAQPALRQGRTRFLDLPEPVLAFVRQVDGAAILCLYNLSREGCRLKVQGAAEVIGPSQAVARKGASLTLGANGFAFLSLPDGAAALDLAP